MDYGFYCDIEVYDMKVILQEPKRIWHFPKSQPIAIPYAVDKDVDQISIFAILAVMSIGCLAALL